MRWGAAGHTAGVALSLAIETCSHNDTSKAEDMRSWRTGLQKLWEHAEDCIGLYRLGGQHV